MSDIFSEVEEKTSLAMTNQMEMLTFHLTDGQLYGINVFKVIEVLECPKRIIKMPNAHVAIKGAIDHRGKPINVIDLSEALGLEPVDYKNDLSYIIVCEYNNVTQGFLIRETDSLVQKNWNDIKSPSGLLGFQAYLTALAYTDDEQTIQILDIEKVLAEILDMSEELSEDMLEKVMESDYSDCHILGVDDSMTARTMLQSVFDKVGAKYKLMDSAVRAFEYLEGLPDEEIAKIGLVVSDIEMPGMDGFTFARKIKKDPRLSGLYVMLHSSMSNKSNMLKAQQVGADDFLAKFNPDVIVEKIMTQLDKYQIINSK